jgi:AraC-like DNA-binding protein
LSSFLKETEPVLPLHGVLVLLSITSERGVSQDSALQGTGIAREMLVNPSTRISYLQLSTLIDNAVRLTGDSALGVECGRRMHIGHLGILGLAMLSQADLQGAFDVLMRYSVLFAPAWELSLEREGPLAVLRTTPTIRVRRSAFAAEVLLGCLRTISTFLLGEPMRFVKHECAMPEPLYADRYRELSDAPIEFGTERNGTWFDASLLEHKLVYADPLTAQLAEHHCASQVSLKLVRGAIAQVQRLLRTRGAQTLSLTEVARELRTSPRQLRRELQAEGASYRQLLDEFRRERALECLLGSRMTVDEIARELGFQDVRHFRRRFKHWTGATPGAFREAHSNSEERAAAAAKQPGPGPAAP